MTFKQVQRSIIFLLFLVLLTVVALLVRSRLADSNTGERLLYKTVHGDRLFLHFFEPNNEKKDSAGPAVICFFGGGWVKGHPRQFYRHCEDFARLGIPAFSAEYRVGLEHGTTPFECVKDAKSAIRWLRRRADRFNIDPNRIIACGASAGGHLVACSALIPDIEDESDDRNINPRPNAMVLFSPVLDTTEAGYGSETFGLRAKDISPIHHVQSGAPPAVIFHGAKDKVVSHKNSLRFCKRMKEKGNQCELFMYPDGKHGFFHHDEAYKTTFQALMQFLFDRGIVQAAEVSSEMDASFQRAVQ